VGSGKDERYEQHCLLVTLAEGEVRRETIKQFIQPSNTTSTSVKRKGEQVVYGRKEKETVYMTIHGSEHVATKRLDKQQQQDGSELMTMRPLSQLIGRIHGPLILLMMTCNRHSGPMALETPHRDALVVENVVVVVWDFDFARELDVVVLLFSC